MNSIWLAEPSTMTLSRNSGAWPTNRKFLPKRLDQKNGIVVKGWYCPNMFLAAIRPCCRATSQCSILTCAPLLSEGKVHTSPAAKRVGSVAELRSGPTTIAPALSSGVPSTKRVFGKTPAPTTTPSAGKTSPSSSSTPFTAVVPRKFLTCADPYHCTPSLWMSCAKDAPTFFPRTRSNGTVSMATTETSQPFLRRVDATSMPMKEPPTTTIFCPFRATFAISAASSGVRSVKMFFILAPGTKSLRGEPPVAINTLS
mmetsp:Transcript_64242/g.153213  ORF Transcript_64242/g.153213 Transcript_64242/m.153213 type:complete len:256 (+) Transcript_64242:250-1017(+)